MNVKIISEMGENHFELQESMVFSLLSTALALQKEGKIAESCEEIFDEGNRNTYAEPEPAHHQNEIMSEARTSLMTEKECGKEENDKEPTKCIYDEIGYKGFLIVKCGHCGVVKAFCSKMPMNEYKCWKCGKETKLIGLKKVYLNCECGSRYMYRTNITDEQFTHNCLNCGYPVELQYNKKKDIFQNM